MQIFKRSPTEDGIKDTWSPVKGLDGKIHPNIIDSNGDYFGLETHRISADGTVSPSVVCPYGCGFHEFIKLDGWEEITEDKQEYNMPPTDATVGIEYLRISDASTT